MLLLLTNDISTVHIIDVISRSAGLVSQLCAKTVRGCLTRTQQTTPTTNLLIGYQKCIKTLCFGDGRSRSSLSSGLSVG